MHKLLILATCVSYLGYGAMIGGCYLSEASGIEEEYWAAVNNNDSIRNNNNEDESMYVKKNKFPRNF